MMSCTLKQNVNFWLSLSPKLFEIDMDLLFLGDALLGSDGGKVVHNML